MKLKVGDKVIVRPEKWYSGDIKVNENGTLKCIITSIDCSSSVIWVRNANGVTTAIYKRWVSTIINRQLLFDFMEH